MVNTKSIFSCKSTLILIILLFGTVSAHSVFAAPLVAKTSLTIVNITRFVNEAVQSPSEVVGYEETVLLYDVEYGYGFIRWKRDPECPWEGVPDTGATTRLWKIWTEDYGRSYLAIGWDFLFPCSKGHERAHDNPEGTRGTMLTTLCDTTHRCNGQERTNIVFWP